MIPHGNLIARAFMKPPGTTSVSTVAVPPEGPGAVAGGGAVAVVGEVGAALGLAPLGEHGGQEAARARRPRAPAQPPEGLGHHRVSPDGVIRRGRLL